MPTRVLWLTKGLGPGGAERLLVEVARRLDPERFDLTAAYVLPWKDHLTDQLESAGVHTVCLSRRDRDLAWPLRLRQLLADDGGFDVVHAHSPVPAAVARVLARTVPADRRPLTVSTEHNTWSSHHPLTRWANRLTGRLDAATFAVTEEVRASMTGCDATRAEVLVHGIDVAAVAARPDAIRTAMRARLGFGPDEFVIGTVANFRPQKDYPNLLAAARLLVDRGERYRILAVGQGPLEADITRRRDELGLRDHVDLLGFRPDAVDVMAACDAFTLASAWEGLPVAVMEALALGLPIVATAVGGVAEHLDATCAVLVPPGDPVALADGLAAVMEHPDKRAVLASGARAAADRFDVGRAAARLATCYDDLSGATRQVQPAAPRRDRRVPAGYEIRLMVDADRPAVLDLLGTSLGWADDERSSQLFVWKHVDNPFGPSPGWVAVADGEIVGVRLFMRWRFRRGTTTVSAVRAVDTATHPDHQGRGLFTSLTTAAVRSCRDEGVDLVFNTPNDQSRPGYLSMGWRVIGRLPLAVRPTSPANLMTIVRSRVPAERWSIPIDVGEEVATWLDRVAPEDRRPGAHDHDKASATDRALRSDLDDHVLRWRYGLHALHYRIVHDEHASIVVRVRRRGDASELVVADQFGNARQADRLAGRLAREVDATYALRLGAPDPRYGFLPLPNAGPILTWRALADSGPPPLPNWKLCLGDVELF